VAVLRASHVGVCVADLGRALRFWRDGLGFRELSRLEVEGSAADTLLELPGTRLSAVYLERDGTCIELLHYARPGHTGGGAPRPMNALGLSHVSLRVDDLDSTAAALAAAGGRVLEHTRTWNAALGAGAIFVLDPDGTRVELVCAPGDPAKRPGQR
jgi:catechol 2,3-dioxygenase-like lactoylglutathione lyase family enzyme